jgi:hypothetical protein
LRSCSTRPSEHRAPQNRRTKFKYSGHGVQGRNARLNEQPRRRRDLNISFSGGHGQKATAVSSFGCSLCLLSSSGRRRSGSGQCKPRQDHGRDGETATAITAMRGKPPPRSLQYRSDTRHFGACPGP